MEACQSLHLNQLLTNQSSASKYWTHARKYNRDPCRLSFTQRACSQARVLAAMRHTMKQTVKLLNAYHVADLFGDLLREKLPTTSVESLCCKLCMGLPSGRRITLINTVKKWKQNDAWNVVRTERYNNTKI